MASFQYHEQENGDIEITGIENDDERLLIVPDYIGGKRVTGIRHGAFHDGNCARDIRLPAAMMRIADSLFLQRWYVERVVLGDHIVEIQDSAFYECLDLERVQLPSCLKTIADYAFCMCNALYDITLPDGLLFLGNECLEGTAIQHIEIPGSAFRVPHACFNGCEKLETVVIEEGVECIEKDAFGDCKSLRNITIPDSTIEIDFSAFRMRTGTFPSQLAILGNRHSYVEAYARRLDIPFIESSPM